MPRRSSASRTAGWSSAGSGAVRASPRGLAGEMRELVADEEVVPERGRAHPAIEAMPRSSTRTIRVASIPVKSASAGATTRVEPPFGLVGDMFAPLARLPIAADDDYVPAGELERPRVNPREAELEHAAGRLAEQFEDLWSRARGERGRQASHSTKLLSERWRGKGSARARSSEFRTTGGRRRALATSRAGGTRATGGSLRRERSAGAGTSTSPRSRVGSGCGVRVLKPGCRDRG